MHPLFGPRERVKRANSKIVTLQKCFEGFFGDNLYKIGVAEYNAKADHHSLRVKSGPKDFPVDWSLLISEIAHNLRSALDGLAWQLALTKTDDPFDRTTFPIYSVGRVSVRRPGRRIPRSFWGKDRADGRSVLRSIPREFWARIESFQPYKRRNGGRHSRLFRLEQLNNTDKHRLLTVLGTLPSSMAFTGLTGGTHFYRRVPLRTDAKIGWARDLPVTDNPIRTIDLRTGKIVEAKMEVNVEITPGVVFGNTCQAVQRLPVIPTLQRISDEVSSVVESFSTEFS